MCQADKEIKHEYFGEPIFSCSKNLLSELYREERLGENLDENFVSFDGEKSFFDRDEIHVCPDCDNDITLKEADTAVYDDDCKDYFHVERAEQCGLSSTEESGPSEPEENDTPPDLPPPAKTVTLPNGRPAKL